MRAAPWRPATWILALGQPAWSPDGETIAFSHLGDGHPELLVPGGYDAAWSPDGEHFAFLYDRPDP